MKVLIFSPIVAVWRPRLPTLLSIAQGHLDAGDEVVFVTCERSVRACTANLEHKAGICNYCVAKKNRGFRLLEGQFREIKLDQGLSPGTAETLKASRDDIATIEALRALHYKNADVGYAAYATYAYVARKAEPNLANKTVRDVIQNLVNTGKLVFEAASSLIATEQADRVVIHHGRGPMDRAVLRAAQAAGVDCWVYETAFSLNQLVCFKSALPQDIANFKERVDRQWEAGGPDRERIGAAFFEMRRSGKRIIEADGKNLATQDRPFIKLQEHGTFPADWDETRKNVVIYGSSHDEFIAISPEYEE